MILKRYLYKEILQNFLAVFLVLILIVFSLRFVRYLGDAAAGKMTAEIIYQLLILKLVTSMTLIIPLCLYLSLFLSLGRLQRDNEMTAMSFAGLGNRFYFNSVLQLVSFFAFILFLLTLFVQPWVEKNIDLLTQRANQESDITGISAGRFKEFSRGNRVIYVEDLDKKKQVMKNVFLQVHEQGSTGVLTSTKANIVTNEKTGERSVLFIDGKRYVGTAGELDYSIIEYERYQVKLEQQGYDTTIPVMSRISTKQLLDSDEPALMAELQWRISSPLSIVILCIFAILMVRSSRESKRTFILMTAVLTFFLYNNLQKIFHDLVLREKINPFPGLWWPHFMMITIILLLFFIPVYWRNKKSSENVGVKA